MYVRGGSQWLAKAEVPGGRVELSSRAGVTGSLAGTEYEDSVG